MDTLHKILDLMWQQGLSDIEFCKTVGINKSAVTDWKKGKTKSYLKHLPKIAQVLGVEEKYLLEEVNFDVSANRLSGTKESNLNDKQSKIIDLTSQLTEEEQEEVIKYAELLKRGSK